MSVIVALIFAAMLATVLLSIRLPALMSFLVVVSLAGCARERVVPPHLDLTDDRPLPLNLSLADAIYDGYMAEAFRLFKNGADVNGRGKRYYGSPLHQAIKVIGKHEGAMEMAMALIDAGADVNTRHGGHWPATPIMSAAYHNMPEIAEVLIGKGAKVNAKTGQQLQMTALHFAARSDAREVAALLLENGANVNAKDSNGETPLDNAISNEYREMQVLLQQHGGRCNEEC